MFDPHRIRCAKIKYNGNALGVIIWNGSGGIRGPRVLNHGSQRGPCFSQGHSCLHVDLASPKGLMMSNDRQAAVSTIAGNPAWIEWQELCGRAQQDLLHITPV